MPGIFKCCARFILLLVGCMMGCLTLVSRLSLCEVCEKAELPVRLE